MKKKELLLSLLLMSTAVTAMGQDNFEPRLHRRCGTSMNIERALANGNTRAVSAAGNYVPHSGQVTIPVILVNFKDVQFSINNPKEAFDQFFNATDRPEALGNGNERNYGSVAKYFSDMSSGEFQLSFKVYGPVTLDRDETYYGGKRENDNNDERPGQLVNDAIAKLQSSDERITDVSDFSSDGNTIDCVYILYAGMSQNDNGAATTVWANTGNASASINGTSVRWYSMAGELSPYKLDSNGSLVRDDTGVTPVIEGIGVTCHELSHALGLPDFYPTVSSACIDNQEMEYWDLMDGGEYTYNGYRPTAYTAFEKNEMGWQVDIKELTESQTVSIANSTEEGGTAYKIVNPDNSDEYFMLECIQKRGWNRSLFGNGLLVYHVNRPSSDIGMMTPFNNTPNYPGMAVVPADGACLSSYINANANYYAASLRGDLFPGTGNMKPDTLNVTELSDAKPQPNFCWYNSAKTAKLATNKALQNISYDTSTGVVSFNYIHDYATGIRNVSTETAIADKQIYSINGTFLGNDLNALPRGIYIVNGKKVVK